MPGIRAGAGSQVLLVSALTERMHTAMQIPPRNQRIPFSTFPKLGAIVCNDAAAVTTGHATETDEASPGSHCSEGFLM